MSALGRLFHHLPATRRSYSSFGGGRYFNSSKPTKSPVVTAKSKSDTSDSTPKDSSTKASSATKTAKSSNTTQATSNAKPTSDTVSSEPGHEAATRDTGATSPSSSAYLGGYPPNPYHNYLSPHPIVNPKDFKIHQFFSLHRPLLLISNPPSILTSAPTDAPLLRSSLLDSITQKSDNNAADADKLPPSPFTSLNLDGTYGNSTTLGASVDEDAEAARQLHHAMTMNRVGSVASWEETLRVLGLDVSKDAERVQLREQWDKEWEEVMMDSVKRKRKKKMKKHK